MGKIAGLIKAIRMRAARKKNRFRKSPAVRAKVRRSRFRSVLRAGAVVFGILSSSAGFLFAHDYFTQSRNFRVQNLTVTGCDRLSETEILETAGITPDVNVLSVNLSVVKKRLIHHPWVETATVSREIPSRLDIHIQEEAPLALLEITGGEGFLVNRSGRIFKRAEGQDQQFRPRVTGLGDGDLPVPGFPDTPAFKAAMEVLRLFAETGPPLFAGVPVHHVRVDPQIGATVYLGEGERTILLGFGPYPEKHAVLSALLDRMQADGRIVNYQCIDLYDVNRIVITPVPVELTRSVSEEVNRAGT